MKKQNNVNSSTTRKEFANYIMGRTIGEGTFGKVKLATHKITGESVAIKILEKDKIVDTADTQRVLREIHILKLIRHTNIVQLYEIIETEKKIFLVMEFMEKGEMFQYIVKNKRLKEEEACEFFHQLLDGIEYLHRIGVVHRDLKPENLLLDHQKKLKIVDFGLSNTYKKMDLLKTPCGSPCYAAPEMLKGQDYEPLKVDIWSSGIILFAMVCGYLPFQDNENTHDLYSKILAGDYTFHKSVSDSAKDLLKKIMTINPKERYTIQEIRKHPWMASRSRKSSSKGLIIGVNKIPIDENVLASLKNYKMELEYVKKCLSANRHNNATTTYYLSMKKYLKEGNKSSCSLGVQEFNTVAFEENRKKSSEKSGIISDRVFYKTEDHRKKDRPIIERVNVKSTDKRTKISSKPSKADAHINSSMNYGRSQTYNSKEKNHKKRQNKVMQNNTTNLNKCYREKFNQSLVSHSKDKVRSRINSSINKTKRMEPGEKYEYSHLFDDIQLKHKKTISKKLCVHGSRSDTQKILKARKL